MTSKELQEEELEVLRSIYEGDPTFKELNPTTFQYKVGEDGSIKSFLLEISWGDNYPDERPLIHLDAFYNKHLIKSVKESILSKLQEQADQFLGSALTYTVLDWAKENAETLLEDQPEHLHSSDEIAVGLENCTVTELEPDNGSPQKKEKKVQLSKAQKRKLYDRVNAAGEHPRGWDWVDIVKHLSQTGSSKESTSNTETNN